MDLNPKTLRAEFHKLTKQSDAIKAKAEPLRAKRDLLVNKFREEELELNAKIREVEKGLFEIENARGALVRALNGKTGDPEEAEAKK